MNHKGSQGTSQRATLDSSANPRCSARHVVGMQYILINRITLTKPKV